MAYLLDINTKCDNCKVSSAKVELLDRWNGRRGQYCRACGKIRLKKQIENEKGT